MEKLAVLAHHDSRRENMSLGPWMVFFLAPKSDKGIFSAPASFVDSAGWEDRASGCWGCFLLCRRRLTGKAVRAGFLQGRRQRHRVI